MTRLSAGKPRVTLSPPRMKMLLVAIVAMGCGADRNPDGISLAEMTQRQCASLTRELASSADEYRTSKPTTSLRYGRTRDERGPASLQLLGRMMSCLGVRRGEQAKLDALGNRLAIAGQTFRESGDRPESIAALDALAAIASEIDALPLRD